MQMTGQRLLPVPPQQTWDALNDPEMLKASIPGCESIVQTEPNRYEVLLAARIGPVAAKFKGRLTQSDVVPPHSYRLEFDGQGGAAGFGKGGAVVRLTPVDAGTQLDYEATAQVGGKLAQIGSRLVDSAARKIADDFFANFEARLVERHGASAAAPAATEVPPSAGSAVANGGGPTAGYAPAPDSGSGAAPVPTRADRVLGDRDAVAAVAQGAADETSGPTANAGEARDAGTGATTRRAGGATIGASADAVAAGAPAPADTSTDTAAAIAASAAGPLAASTLPAAGAGETAAAPGPVRGGPNWVAWAIAAAVAIALIVVLLR